MTSSQPNTFFVSHIYFGFAINFNEKAINNPLPRKNLNPLLLSSVILAFMSLEAFVHEYMSINQMFPENPEDLKYSLSTKIKNIIGAPYSGQEPYNSVKLLGEMRHALVHINPSIEMKSFESCGLDKRSQPQTKLDQEFSTRYCIPDDCEIAISAIRPITEEGANWASDTTFLMMRQIENIGKKKKMKSVLDIIEKGDVKINYYKLRSRYFKNKYPLM